MNRYTYRTSEGDILVGGSFRGEKITVGDYELVNSNYKPQTNEMGLIIRYNNNGDVEWASSQGREYNQ